MRWIILAYLFINPMIYIPGMMMRGYQETCFILTSILVFASSLFFKSRDLKPCAINTCLAAMLIWFVYCWLALPSQVSILFNLVFGMMVYIAVIRTINKEDFDFIFKGIGVLAAVTLGYLIAQYVNYDMRGQLLQEGQGVPHCSFYGLKAALGMGLAMMAPLVLAFSWAGLLLLFPIALSYSTGAALAGVVSIQFFLWFRKRVAFWLMLIPILAGLAFFIVKMDNPMGMQGTRISMWKLVVQDIHATPLGHGLDSFRNPTAKMMPATILTRYFKQEFDDRTIRVQKKIQFQNLKEEGWVSEKPPSRDAVKGFNDKVRKGKNPLTFWDHPHNEYLWIAYEAGIPALIILGFLLFFIWKRFLLSARDTYQTALAASLLALCMFSLTHFPFHLARVGNMIPVIAGLFYVSTIEE